MGREEIISDLVCRVFQDIEEMKTLECSNNEKVVFMKKQIRQKQGHLEKTQKIQAEKLRTLEKQKKVIEKDQ